MGRELRLLALVVAAALLAGCAGGDGRSVRIGVITDCEGIYRPLEDAELSGAALPLIERGAELRGRRASDGLTAARAGGRRVELVQGCTEAGEYSALTTEVRRLIELEHVDAIVAGSFSADEVVLRDLARGHPRVIFVPTVHGPREATLRRPAPNLYRFAADHGQGVAGLASFAYTRLGWRRVAVALGGWDLGWGGADAFAAELCALGGTVTSRVQFDPGAGDASKVPRDVDGVAVFASSFYVPGALIRQLARRVGAPERHLVVGPGIADDPDVLRSTARSLEGVIGSSNVDPVRRREYLRAFRSAFPGVPDRVAAGTFVTGFRDAVEAVLRGLERAGGDTERLPAALAGLRTDLLGGAVRLDASRQGIVSTRLVRIGGGAEPSLTPLRAIGGVDQSIGGLLEPSVRPSWWPPKCRRQQPPPWAR
jgi:branched-chain amino acid transport system substrate-binding protein